MKKGIALTLSGLYGGICFLVYYIISAVKATSGDEYGMSIAGGNRDLLVLSIILLFVGAYGIYCLLLSKKQKSENPYYFPFLLVADGAIGFFYFLGVAIGNGQEGISLASPLLIAIFFLIPLGIGIWDLVTEVKKSSNQ